MMTRDYRWVHECDPAWLEARKNVLTATEAASLKPQWTRRKKSMEPGEVLPGFAAVWAKKHTPVSYDQVVSYGAPARGHILEPYAVAEWNARHPDTPLHHWDDAIIANAGLAFSPDALSVPQPDDGKLIYDAMEMAPDPLYIGEIKSYNTERHMAAVTTPQEKLDERWQVAAAFAVCTGLQAAFLLFYNPDCPVHLKEYKYTREDLHDEIATIEEICDEFWRTAHLCAELVDGPALKSEDEIYTEWEKEVYGGEPFDNS